MSDSNTTSSNEWTFKTEEEIAKEQNALQMTTSVDNAVMIFTETNPCVMKLDPTRMITFYNNGGEVGRLDFSTGELQFVGKADEAARSLFEALKPFITQFFYDKQLEIKQDINEFMSTLYGQPRG